MEKPLDPAEEKDSYVQHPSLGLEISKLLIDCDNYLFFAQSLLPPETIHRKFAFWRSNHSFVQFWIVNV